MLTGMWNFQSGKTKIQAPPAVKTKWTRSNSSQLPQGTTSSLRELDATDAAQTLNKETMARDSASRVWVSDPQEAWSIATIESLCEDDEYVTVSLQKKHGRASFDVLKSDTRVWDPSHILYLEDAANLNNLHEASLLNLLRTRFAGDDIYTYTGDVLISVNPYKDIPLLYKMPNDPETKFLERRRSSQLLRSANIVVDSYSDSSDEETMPQGRSSRQLMDAESVLDHPHVYTIANKAYCCMIDPSNTMHGDERLSSRNQSIIITGESGAGKTEAAKYVMKYLIHAKSSLESRQKNLMNSQTPGHRVECTLLQSTTILEAFGNAKTVRNDNSSRFGKYIKLEYGTDWRIVRARTLHFLLEKSRLVHQDQSERNYHIFYQLCRAAKGAGVKSNMKKDAIPMLGDASNYKILNQGGVYTQSEDVDDLIQFEKLCQALSTIGVDRESRECLWSLLALLLHMGNIVFKGRPSSSSSSFTTVELQSSSLSLEELANGLGLEADELVENTIMKNTQTGGSFLSIPLDAIQAKANLDGLVKHIYGQIFSWLVGIINLGHHDVSKGDNVESVAFIGILDIFGFEIMNTNSFEQLCINFANEVLQQQFNHQVFVLEQDTYKSEGLDWKAISYRDNQGVIDLISKKPSGLLIQLEELGALGRRADNKALLQLYHNTHVSKNEHYSKPRFEGPQFIVRHFAGSVTYEVEGFLQKNNDSLQDSLLELLQTTSNDFLHKIMFQTNEGLLDMDGEGLKGTPKRDHRRCDSKSFSFSPPSYVRQQQNAQVERRKTPKREHLRTSSGRFHMLATTATVSRTFRGQLSDLMSTLRRTEPHYIKCIKPNTVKAPGGFSPHLVCEQLNYSGVLEVVRIRREAYPVRVAFSEFYDKFAMLYRRALKEGKVAKFKLNNLPGPSKASDQQAKQAVEVILKHYMGSESDYFQIGHTLVFMKEEGLEILRRTVRREYNRCSRVITALIRRRATQQRVKRRKEAAVMIQKTFRMSRDQKSYQLKIRSACTIQRMVRVAGVRRRYQGHRASAIQIQAIVRGAQQRKRYLKMVAAVAVIQRASRIMLASCRLKRLRASREYRAAEIIQAAWLASRRKKFRTYRHTAAMRVQTAVRSYLRNRQLINSIEYTFRAAKNGNVDAVSETLRKNPQLIYLRNRRDHFKSLLHAAAQSGNMSLVSLLRPFSEDLELRDSDGNTPLHYAVASAKYDLVKYLASRADVCNDDIVSKNTELNASKRVSQRIAMEARQVMFQTHTRSQSSRCLGSIMLPSPDTSMPSPTSASHLKRGSSNSQMGLSVVHSGWLQKRRETGRWFKRWCVAFSDCSLNYYHSQKDFLLGKSPANRIHLERAMLHKCPDPETPNNPRSACFAIYSQELLRYKRNKEGRLYFKAISEEDAYAWLVPLRVLCKDHNLKVSQAQGFTRYVNMGKRASLVCALNKKFETPLHFAANRPDNGYTESLAVARVQIASWLIENGALVNAASISGDTPIHMALKNDHIGLAAALARRGGNLSLKTKEGVSCLDLLDKPEYLEQVVVGFYKAADLNQLLPPPNRLEDLSYLSIHVEKLSMHTTSGLTTPFLTISVHDMSGKRLERPQDVNAPVIVRPTYLWWGTHWHMQNPLEHLGEDCLILIELKDQNIVTSAVSSLGWSLFHFNSTTVSSHEASLEMFLPPVDFYMRVLSPAELFLSGEIMLTTGGVRYK